MRAGTIAAAVLAAGALSTASLAGEGYHAQQVVEHIFDVADQDQSGTLSSAEYAEAGLERYGVSFDETDTDGNGETSLEEYLELYERHHPAEDRAGI